MADTLKLLLRGWVPRSIVYGLSAVHAHGYAMNQLRPIASYEVEVLSKAKILAGTRAEQDARTIMRDHGGGAVGASLTFQRTPQDCNGPSVLVEGLFTATTVVRYRDPIGAISMMRDLGAST